MNRAKARGVTHWSGVAGPRCSARRERAKILIDVDRDTNFTAALTHAGAASPRLPAIEHRRNLYAAILAQACNYGTAHMAELTGIPADAIDWATR